VSVHYDDLPPKVRAQIDAADPPAAPRRARRKPHTITMRCHACRATFTGTYASIERHADTHGHARLELDLGVTAPAGKPPPDQAV